MQTYNSFNELAAAQAATPLVSAMSVFNASYKTDQKLTPEKQAKLDAFMAFVNEEEQKFRQQDDAFIAQQRQCSESGDKTKWDAVTKQRIAAAQTFDAKMQKSADEWKLAGVTLILDEPRVDRTHLDVTV